jgi:hypothetical protein
MSDMPRRNPRDIVQRTADLALTSATLDIRAKHDMTDVEYLQWLASEQQSVLKFMLREERHPDDPDKPAGWE